MKSRMAQSKANSKLRYCFRTGEELPYAIKRILHEQLSRAVQVLCRPDNSLEEAVHEARRCLKRSRSLLRLIQFAIPNTYRRENQRLRDVGRSLSELRDSHALLKTLEDLDGRRSTEQSASRHRAFLDARTFLESRGQQIEKAMDEGGMKKSIEQLKAALTHIEKLNFTKINLRGIQKSLYRSVKRGIKAFALAEEDGKPETFHEWRKRAKDLRYQLSLFAELHPNLEQYSKSAKDLEQLLGDDHNLAVLTELLTETHDSDGELHFLQKKISGRQSALRDEARKIGRHLYGEKRKVWKDRLAPIAPAS